MTLRKLANLWARRDIACSWVLPDSGGAGVASAPIMVTYLAQKAEVRVGNKTLPCWNCDLLRPEAIQSCLEISTGARRFPVGMVLAP